MNLSSLSTGGTSLWFASNGQGGYTRPAGDFSTLVQNTNGSYTQTLTDGTQINFNSSGQETSSVDRDGNTTTFGYTSGLLTSITDMNNQVTTLAYNASGLLSTITDPANRTATLTYTGSQLTSITDPDNDVWQYGYDSSNDLTALTDPNNNTTTFTYNTADRVSSVTNADHTTDPASQLTAMQMNGWAAAGSSNVTAVLLATGDQALFTDGNSNVWTSSTAKDFRKSRKRHQNHERECESAQPAQPAQPFDGLEQSELRMLLHAEVQRLPEKYRLPFVLRFVEGKSRAKTAALLGLTKGMVAQRVKKAREILSDNLAHRGIDLTE